MNVEIRFASRHAGEQERLCPGCGPAMSGDERGVVGGGHRHVEKDIIATARNTYWKSKEIWRGRAHSGRSLQGKRRAAVNVRSGGGSAQVGKREVYAHGVSHVIGSDRRTAKSRRGICGELVGAAQVGRVGNDRRVYGRSNDKHRCSHCENA